MIRRVGSAGAGAALCGGLLAAVLAVLPWRPADGLLVAVALIALATPATAMAGTRLGLRAVAEDDRTDAGRLAAWTAPVLVLVGVFSADLIAGSASPGAQQLAALLVGITSAGALAARFTGAAADRFEEQLERERGQHGPRRDTGSGGP